MAAMFFVHYLFDTNKVKPCISFSSAVYTRRCSYLQLYAWQFSPIFSSQLLFLLLSCWSLTIYLSCLSFNFKGFSPNRPTSAVYPRNLHYDDVPNPVPYQKGLFGFIYFLRKPASKLSSWNYMRLNKYLFNRVNNKDRERGQRSVVWLKCGQPCLHRHPVLNTVFSWRPFSSFSLWIILLPPSLPPP